MTDQSQGKIFLSADRGRNETERLRSYNTFNFGNYFNPYKTAVGDLYVLNDDTIAGGHSAKMHIDQDSFVVFIPIVGAIDYCDTLGNNCLIGAGETKLIPAPAGTFIEVTNPYEQQLVNYLHLRIKAKDISLGSSSTVSFDIAQNKNKLIDITGNNGATNKLPFKISITKLDGRSEVLYDMVNNKRFFYAYVIEGAFEVAGRLLHARDGLALWNIKQVDAEALSNDAILLIIELY
jgi:quercetin 2,3-dioxygenase